MVLGQRIAVTRQRELMVYSDVDGTLVSESNRIEPILEGRIKAFVKEGFGFSLATGRCLGSVKRFLMQLPINAPIVLCNGAYVYDPLTERSWFTSLEKEIVHQILLHLETVRNIRIYIDRSDNSLWVSDNGVKDDPFIIQENLQPNVWKAIPEVTDGGEILKIGVKCLDTSEQTVKQVKDTISGIVSLFHTKVKWCFSSQSYLEILPAGVSKWSGIVISQAMRGCKDHQIYTIGDQQNDIEMIQHADVGVAMENAVEEVKKVAAYQIGHVKNDAVAYFLNQFLINQNAKKSII